MLFLGGLRGARGILDWVTSLWLSLMYSGTWGAKVVVLAYIVLASCCRFLSIH